MIDDNKYARDFNESESDSPPPALFDEAASANAKPVEPIPTGRSSIWVERARHARNFLTVRRKALALVLVGGLTFGTIGGTLLVNERDSSPHVQSIDQESIAETTAAANAPGDADPIAETAALDTLGNAVQRANRASTGNGRRRFRTRVQPANRAYRVAVIR